MADPVEVRMNVTSIKRVDPYIKEILCTATHVALYRFNITANEWEKTETEGALFVYSRHVEPFQSLMLVNRLNTNNVVEPIVSEFDYQMQLPFLLYRNYQRKIFGVWFFNQDECIRITYLIDSLMEQFKKTKPTTTEVDRNDDGNQRQPEQTQAVDIFGLLTKAQEDFNRTPTRPQNAFSSSTPRHNAFNCTSKSVQDFFAKASNQKTGGVRDGAVKTNSQPEAARSSGTETNVLQRLMSNPAHSVEHIEKQQRSNTPQGSHQKKKPSRNHSEPGTGRPNVVVDGFMTSFGSQTKSKAKKSAAAKVQQCRDVEHLQQSPSTPQKYPLVFNNSSLNNTANSSLTSYGAAVENDILPVATSNTNHDADEQQILNANDKDPPTPRIAKKQLMTPMMFTTAAVVVTDQSVTGGDKDDDTGSVAELASASTHQLTAPAMQSSSNHNTDHYTTSIDLLTEKQLAQALIHLLKTNGDFTKQIHQAYVNSILEKVELLNKQLL